VRAAVEEQRQLVPQRTILMRCLFDRPVPVVADADRIGQVVTNYLTNALKYSLEERPVEVGIQIHDQQARVWVSDQGPGLSPAEQEHLWQHFYRVPGVEVQSGSGIGLGLGLYISKTIIDQHQGQVGVQSTLGKGSTFWFTLPLAA
jgi:signal transduction histidine kinase